MKRQPSEWEKIIANKTTGKELISKMYKQLIPLNTRKINDPIKKRAKELNVPHFLKKVFCHLIFRAWAVSFSTDIWLLCVHRYVVSKTKFWTLNKTKPKDEFIFKAYGLQNRETQGDRQCFLLLTDCRFLFFNHYIIIFNA